MKLLTPNEVKTQKTRSETERVSRIGKLQKEESESVRRLNDALTKEKIQMDRLKSDTTVAELKEKLDVEKVALLGEVTDLENRKTKALEPIIDREKESEALMSQLKSSLAKVKSRGESLTVREDELSERIEVVVDRESELPVLEQDLEKRKKGIEVSEVEIGRQTKILGEKWLEYHTQIYESNDLMSQREKKVADATKSNNAYAIELSKKETDLMAREIALKDKYETLARSQKEILEGKRDVEKIKSP